MSGVKLPEMGRDLWMRPPLETAIPALEDACQSSVGFGLSVRLRERLWIGLRDPLASLRHSLGEPR